MQLSTVPVHAVNRLWRYCLEGGIENAVHLLRFSASLLGRDESWREPLPLLRAVLYWSGLEMASYEDVAGNWRSDRPVAAIVFYRALLQAGNLAAIDALVFKCHVLWSQLDALHHAYVQPGHVPPGAFLAKEDS